jgi:AMMECR1 domain-containing protein
MPLVSRRDLISAAGVAVGAAALLPRRLFSSSGNFADSAVPLATLSACGRIERVKNAPYSGGQQEEILNLAQHALARLFEGKTLSELQPDGDRLGISAAERVNITLRHAGRIRGSMSAPGSNLGRQVIESVYATAMDRSYGGPLTRWELADTRLEVWIQIGSSEISHDARSGKNVLLLGVEGLEIEGRGQLAYYLPSVVITSKYKTDIALFEALCLKAGLEKDAWLRPDVSVRKTRWLCLPSVSNAHFFGRESDADAKLPMPLNSSIEGSASYLIRNQDASGRTAYLYDPIGDLFVGKTTNLVRSAGCLFALSQVLQSNHRIARDGGFKACTVTMARGLLNLTSLTGNGMRVLQEEEAGKIPGEEKATELSGDEEEDRETPEDEKKAGKLPSVGATALLAAALSGGLLRKEFGQEYKQLYRSIVSAQKPDGRFLTYFGETQENKRVVNFYPGEALLVLALEAEWKNSEALEMCRRAFQPYVLHFRAAPTSAFTVWHINVWSRIALLTGEHAYADFVFEQADWLLQIQVKSHHDLRWVGGFSQSGAAPQAYSIAFTEAIARALTLAVRAGDAERTKTYADCVRSGLRFCRLLKIEETQATLLGNPMRCKGGVAFGLTDRRVRCDVVQHLITLCLAAEQTKNYLL